MLAARRLRTIVVSGLALTVGCAQDGDVTQKTDQILSDSPELRALYEQDQADRSGDNIDWAVVSPRDSSRRERVLELLGSNQLRTSEDYRHAAMVLQHGSDTTAARLAHDLAKEAVVLDSTNAEAKWLLAASWDRYQIRLGEPQWYGTQYVRDSQNGWRLYDIDTTAVSDQERQQLGAPTLAEVRARLEESNRPSNLPLREIMRGLEADLAAVAHGIWTEDHEAVRTAAKRIAEHPKVIPEQVAAIQAALGGEFPAFVQHDQAVHGAAMDLVEAVDSSRTTSELFTVFTRVQQGCMSCHSGFRSRVAEALTGANGGT